MKKRRESLKKKLKEKGIHIETGNGYFANSLVKCRTVMMMMMELNIEEEGKKARESINL